MSKETVFQKFKDEMEKVIITLGKSFSRVRTGRASVALLD
jgi:ribosome recycling factor